MAESSVANCQASGEQKADGSIISHHQDVQKGPEARREQISDQVPMDSDLKTSNVTNVAASLTKPEDKKEPGAIQKARYSQPFEIPKFERTENKRQSGANAVSQSISEAEKDDAVTAKFAKMLIVGGLNDENDTQQMKDAVKVESYNQPPVSSSFEEYPSWSLPPLTESHDLPSTATGRYSNSTTTLPATPVVKGKNRDTNVVVNGVSSENMNSQQRGNPSENDDAVKTDGQLQNLRQDNELLLLNEKFLVQDLRMKSQECTQLRAELHQLHAENNELKQELEAKATENQELRHERDSILAESNQAITQMQELYNVKVEECERLREQLDAHPRPLIQPDDD